MSRKSAFTALVCLLAIVASQSAALAIVQQDAQSLPIELGTTGGNINDSSSAFCCSGTLGALVEDSSGQYILSNNHVMARSNNGSIGDAVIQPGLIDQSPVCSPDVNDSVAHLSDFVRIRFWKGRSIPINHVDAAIAAVVPGSVDPNGSILEIGELSADTLDASIGLAVKKSGRTSGLTSGSVLAINVTADIGYSKSCGGAANQGARFKDQILIGPANFSAGGDSGSIIVEDVAANPRAVGLLFAGSSTTTIANPIGDVLAAFGVTMPGGAAPVPPAPADPGTIAGNVATSPGGDPIEGAIVTVDGLTGTTLGNGDYVINDVPAGDHSVRATADGFKSQTKNTTVIEGQSVTVNFALKQQKGGGGGGGRPSNRGRIARAIAAQNRHESRIFNISGVVGMGVGISEGKDHPVIEVYLADDDARVRGQIPATLDNVEVRIVVTGAFEAF